MRLADGTPLLLERVMGAGRVLLFTSSLDREWNDLPVQPAFVPLMAGIANHLLGGAGFTSEADLGSTLSVRALGLSILMVLRSRREAIVRDVHDQLDQRLAGITCGKCDPHCARDRKDDRHLCLR